MNPNEKDIDLLIQLLDQQMKSGVGHINILENNGCPSMACQVPTLMTDDEPDVSPQNK